MDNISPIEIIDFTKNSGESILNFKNKELKIVYNRVTRTSFGFNLFIRKKHVAFYKSKEMATDKLKELMSEGFEFSNKNEQLYFYSNGVLLPSIKCSKPRKEGRLVNYWIKVILIINGEYVKALIGKNAGKFVYFQYGLLNHWRKIKTFSNHIDHSKGIRWDINPLEYPYPEITCSTQRIKNKNQK